ncbi:MAG: molecular chaperone TorD family protein [Planctomycetota bacterium]|nr:molecular chaperone TorD family protein [Planctomycetota bacterium]
MRATGEVGRAARGALEIGAIYRLLSQGVHPPDPERRSSLVRDLVRIESNSQSEQGGLFPKIIEYLIVLRESLEETPKDELVESWTRLFGNTIQGESPPYEGQYGDTEVFRQWGELAGISGFYHAFGLEVSSEVRERADHLSVEFEFLHYLAYREANALERHGSDKAKIYRDARGKLLVAHTLLWVPEFTRRMERIVSSGFYAHLARLTRRFLEEEGKRLGLELNEGDLPIRADEPLSEVSCSTEGGPP